MRSCSGSTPTGPDCPTASSSGWNGRSPRYGVRGLDRTPELDEAVVWMFRSFRRVDELVPVVTVDPGAAAAGPRRPGPAGRRGHAGRLDRLGAACQGRHQAVAELARDVRFHYFDEPLLEALLARAYAQTERALDALARRSRTAPTATRTSTRLVGCPQPLRGDAAAPLAGKPTTRDFARVLLEVYARRFYRTRDLRDLRFASTTASQLCAADYDWGDKHIHLVAAYAPLDELPDAVPARSRPTSTAEPTRQREVVVDVGDLA